MISKKKQEGVTLISLVITIIILIILASISIKVLLGEDGLITKAKEVKKAQKIGEIKERISLEISAAQAEAILRNEELEKAQVKDIIEPKYGTLKEDGDTIVIKEGNYEISLQEIYYGALSESGSYSAKVEQVEMLEQELADLKEQYKNLEETNNGNTKQLEDLDNKITELESTKQRLEEELKTAQANNETLQTDKENLEKEKKDLQQELETAQASNTTLQEENTNLKNEKKNLENSLSKVAVSGTYGRYNQPGGRYRIPTLGRNVTVYCQHTQNANIKWEIYGVNGSSVTLLKSANSSSSAVSYTVNGSTYSEVQMYAPNGETKVWYNYY